LTADQFDERQEQSKMASPTNWLLFEMGFLAVMGVIVLLVIRVSK
jgi:hypothetical protein